MSVTVLIDGNNVGYIEHYATKLKSGTMETQAIFGYLRRMRDLKKVYGGCNLIVLWDGRAQWRFDLHPAYKSNREDDVKKRAIKAAYTAQKPYIQKCLTHLGITQITHFKAEADDMAGYLSQQISSKPGNLVLLYSGDRDWLQLVKPGVSWRDPKTGNLITHDSFEADTGYRDTFEFLQGKALQGDNADVIDGIPWMGEKGACEFMRKWGRVERFFGNIKAGMYMPQRRKSATSTRPHPEETLASLYGWNIFSRNMKLMDLMNVPKPDPKDLLVARGKPDKEALTRICEELAFMSLVKDMDSFFSNFQTK